MEAVEPIGTCSMHATAINPVECRGLPESRRLLRVFVRCCIFEGPPRTPCPNLKETHPWDSWDKLNRQKGW